MTVTYMPLSPVFGARRPGLFRKTTRDALADLVAERYRGAGKRKRLMRDFGLTEDQARAVIEGSGSQAALDAMLDKGRWELALELLAIRFGEHVTQHLAREAARHAERAQAADQMARTLRSWAGSGAGGACDGAAQHPGGLASLARGEAERRVRSRS